MSAISFCTIWKSAIGRPNCSRSRAQPIECSSAACASPTEIPARVARSTSSPRIIIATPRFSSPIRSATSTRMPSKRSSAVGLPRMPILSSLRLQLKPGRLPVDQEHRDPVRPARRIGARVDDQRLGFRAVGDEGLAAVEHVVVALAHRARAHAERVGAGARLGERPGADRLAAAQSRQHAALLLRRAVARDRSDAQHGVRAVRERDRAGDAGQLFHDQGRADVVAAAAAVLLGHQHAERADLAQAQEEVARETSPRRRSAPRWARAPPRPDAEPSRGSARDRGRGSSGLKDRLVRESNRGERSAVDRSRVDSDRVRQVPPYTEVRQRGVAVDDGHARGCAAGRRSRAARADPSGSRARARTSGRRGRATPSTCPRARTRTRPRGARAAAHWKKRSCSGSSAKSLVGARSSRSSRAWSRRRCGGTLRSRSSCGPCQPRNERNIASWLPIRKMHSCCFCSAIRSVDDALRDRGRGRRSRR